MNPEEQGIMLSAYLDGELDEAQRAEVEKMLESDQELAKELGGMKELGLALNRALDDEAANVDFASMREAVLREMSDIEPSRVVQRTAQPEAPKVGFWDMLRSLVERPAVAFAMGILVAGLWSNYSSVQSDTDTGQPTLDSVAPASITADNVPPAPMRAPETEQSFSKASPSLVLETLSVENGKVVLDQPDDDPDAPVVLWHFSESGGEASGDSPKLPAAPVEEQHNEGDPL